MRGLPGRGECATARNRTLDAIFEGHGAIPPEAEEHLAGCSRCRTEIDAWVRLDGGLASTLGRMRGEIRVPGTGDIDRILSAVRETPPAALLFRRLRRSIKRMLFLTLIVLSFLAVAGIAWALALALKAAHGAGVG